MKDLVLRYYQKGGNFMNYELIKDEFIKLKREELDYIDNIAKISSIKKLSEYEKLEIYRNLNNYRIKLTELLKNIFSELVKNKSLIDIPYEKIIIEFDIDKNFLSSVKFNSESKKKYRLNDLGINESTFKFELTFRELLYIRDDYRGIDSDIIQSDQKLIEKQVIYQIEHI